MICQCCGVEAPTHYVEFYQNIGALFVRFHKSIKGKLCKPCINKYFWEFTAINLTIGWWGTISFFLTPFLILNNIIRYIGSLKLPRPPAGAVPPKLTQEDILKLEPYLKEIVARINQGEKLEQVVQSVAPRVGVTPGQVMLYIYEIYQVVEQQQQPT